MEEYISRLKKERSRGTETDPYADLEEILEREYENEKEIEIRKEDAGEKAKADSQMVSRLRRAVRSEDASSDPEQNYLIDKKWMQYYDKYDLSDAETNVFAKKAIKEYRDQLKTAYSHDGMVTLREIRQYAGQINSTKKSDQFLKDFCRAVIQQTMIDRTFAGVLSKQSEEYAELSKEAAHHIPALMYKTNVSGLEKVSNCVGRKERERVREDLKRLRRETGDAWLLQIIKDNAAKLRWQENVRTDQVLPDPKSSFEPMERFEDTEASVPKMAGRILNWGRELYENSYVKQLLLTQDGAPDAYLDREMRSFIVSAKARCAYYSDLLDQIKQRPDFDALPVDTLLLIKEADRWITGYGRWFSVHAEQIKNWDDYFGKDEEERKSIPYEKLPKPLEKISYYFK